MAVASEEGDGAVGGVDGGGEGEGRGLEGGHLSASVAAILASVAAIDGAACAAGIAASRHKSGGDITAVPFRGDPAYPRCARCTAIAGGQILVANCP